MSKIYRKCRTCRKCKINGYGLCLVLEILFNICNLIIIPKKKEYEKKIFMKNVAKLLVFFLVRFVVVVLMI